jgi:hypothetical protein
VFFFSFFLSFLFFLLVDAVSLQIKKPKNTKKNKEQKRMARDICNNSPLKDKLGLVKQLKDHVATHAAFRQRFSAPGIQAIDAVLEVPGAAPWLVSEALVRCRKTKCNKTKKKCCRCDDFFPFSLNLLSFLLFRSFFWSCQLNFFGSSSSSSSSAVA